MIPAKTAEPTEVPFMTWTRVGPRSRVLVGEGLTVVRRLGLTTKLYTINPKDRNMVQNTI